MLPFGAVVFIAFCYGGSFGVGVIKAIRDESWGDFALALLWALAAFAFAMTGGK